MTEDISLPMLADMLIPHRPSVQLIKRLLDFQDSCSVTESVIKSDCPFLDKDGSIGSPALIEIIAQSYAAHKGFKALLEGTPVRKGFLVGIRNFLVFKKVFSGDVLRIKISPVGSIDGFFIAEGDVYRNDEEHVAKANIKLWIPQEVKE